MHHALHIDLKQKLLSYPVDTTHQHTFQITAALHCHKFIMTEIHEASLNENL